MKTPLTSPKNLVFLVICAALFLSTGFMNKYGIIEKIAQKLDAYSREHLSEQIYLHLDKDRVLPGETLWFKAYRKNPNPAVIRKESSMMTLELWDTEGKRKLKQYFEIQEGSATGSLVIADTLPPGNYLLTAYTEHMKGLDRDSYYHRTIFVGNHQWELSSNQTSRDSLYTPGNPLDLDLQFFPESGSLIAGIPSRVAFKATDGNGNPVDVEGQLVDKNGRVMGQVKSHYAGTGAFQAGSQNKGLKVKIQKPFSMKSTFSLPSPYKEGCSITVKGKNKDSLHVMVRASNSFSGKDLALAAIMNGEIKWSKTFTGSKERHLTIPTGKLPMGVLTLNVFDSRLLQLARRPVFINHFKRLFVEIAVDSQNRAVDQVTLDITVSDHKGNPSPAELSLAVSDISRLDNPHNTPSLLSHHSLKHFIWGEIQTPEAFFNHTDKAKKAMDHLLMIHGWSQQRWKKVLTYDSKKKREDHPFLTGRILTRKGKGAGNATVELFTPKFDIKQNTLISLLESDHTPAQLDNQKYFRYLRLTADRKGYFEVTPTQFKQVVDTGEVLVRARKKDGGSDVLIRFPLKEENEKGKMLATQIKTQRKLQRPFTTGSDYIPFLQNEKIDTNSHIRHKKEPSSIKDTNINSRRKRNIPETPGRRDHPVREKQVKEPKKRYSQIRSYEELIKHISAAGAISGGRIFLRGADWLCNVIPATIIIDDSRVGTRLEMINDRVNYDRIRDVKIINNPGKASRYVGGKSARGGVVIIETKQGPEKIKTISKEDEYKNLVTIGGYQVQKEFPSPKDPAGESKTDRQQLGKTLYWNPTVQIDSSGKGTVTFYAPDTVGRVICTVNGLNGKKPGSAREVFMVY